ncbi:hypothetical protein A2U01_0071282, partial [Trifolium medium]|nr:hypothetical protein [Trifolium medium]
IQLVEDLNEALAEPAAQVEDDTTSDNNDLEDPTNGNSTEELTHSEGSEYEDNTTETLAPRTRKPPAWVRYFVTDIEQHDEEQLQNLAVFCNSEDPTCYEEA